MDGIFMCFFPCLPLEPEAATYMSQSYSCHCGSADCDHRAIGEDTAERLNLQIYL
jgi:hypothetical protein